MADKSLVYDLDSALLQKDILPFLAMALVKFPVLNQILAFSTEQVSGNHEQRFEWSHDVDESIVATLAANYTAAGTVTVASGDGAKFVVGDQFYIEGHKDTNYVRVVFKVASIATDTLTVTVVSGADTNFTNPSPAAKIRIMKSFPDNADVGTGGMREPTRDYNYLQLFQQSILLGKKAQRTINGGLMPGINNMFATALQQKVNQMSQDIYNSVVYGVGNAETSATNPSKMRGILNFILTSSTQNKVDGSAAALSEDMINDLVEKLLNLGMSQTGRKILLVSPTNARKISALRNDKIQIMSDGLQGITLGTNVQNYITEIPGTTPITIQTDFNFPNDIAALLSIDEMMLVSPTVGPPASIEPVDNNGAYGDKWVLRSELSLKLHHALRYHGIIYNFT